MGSVSALLNPTLLLRDLQRINRLVQQISGCLEPEPIAAQITKALVENFNCIFARIWLVESDRSSLRLVASAGLYTHLDGSFAKVPMGAYKVGKIAQNCVPFLSNHLADEAWVKDRDWAIANKIQGFAGYPLMTERGAIGVLATFSQETLAPEFLEVLQVLCMTTTIAIDAALQSQQIQQEVQRQPPRPPLSDQLAAILTSTRLVLVGTEQSLSASIVHLYLQTAERLAQLHCEYCRLTYEEQAISLEAIIELPTDPAPSIKKMERVDFGELQFLADRLGGVLDAQTGVQERMLQFSLRLPYAGSQKGEGDQDSPMPSEREQEIMVLLAQGYRDRNIAQHLHISESTVKFHVNNSLVKLDAKNRYQGVYQATLKGWI
ncbi:Response regulator protein VraR [Acaryochloris thomasi RCC1774]|uniref:Response regulator protein VraR n=1 Tax=Acaryochloris thomasi RCC1774 TaxID=1764569 RepID=A0A2W1JVM3_9CYAN|nr:LuxR C-terminal-related transcriptional regulator [Acaryochloris thomasi]PZD73784.1 Response regulator protein VraR [Acaryochloris thomasi RCC1774]